MKQPAPPQLPVLIKNDFFIEDEAYFEANRFTNSDYSYLTGKNIIIRQSELEKITLHKTRLDNFEASNVIFRNCDFSNIEWLKASFHQVIFEQCKLTGANFAESYLRDCQFHDCLCDFVSFSQGNLKVVTFANCRLTDSEFYNLKWQHINFINNDLTGSNWGHTSLNKLDFSNNKFYRIILEQENLRGLIVNSQQALVIAASLGLVIKD